MLTEAAAALRHCHPPCAVRVVAFSGSSVPAHRRAVASRPEGYHSALAAAMALAPLAVESAKEHAFITEFLASWGEALDRRPRRR